MTDSRFTTIQAFRDAISGLREATVRGIVLEPERKAVERLYAHIRDIPGVDSPSGESGSAHELLKWLATAFGAFRVEQDRRRADAASHSEPTRA